MTVRQLKSGSYNYRVMKNGKVLSFTSKTKIEDPEEIQRRFELSEDEAAEIEGRKHKDHPFSYVYFISDHHGAIKVGMACNVAKRLKTLQTSNPYKLDAIFAFQYNGMSAKKGERFWQRVIGSRFDSLMGEWFKATDEEIKKYVHCYLKKEGSECQKLIGEKTSLRKLTAPNG